MLNSFRSNGNRLAKCAYLDDFITGSNCVAEDNFTFNILKQTIQVLYYYLCHCN